MLIKISLLYFLTSLFFFSFIGAGSLSSDAISWFEQINGYSHHHNNFPGMVKIFFSSITFGNHFFWHFIFLQIFSLKLSFHYLIQTHLQKTNNSQDGHFFALIATLIFFLNPYTISHISKWYIDYFFAVFLAIGLISFQISKEKNVFKLSYLGLFFWFFGLGLRYNGPPLIIVSFLTTLSLFQHFKIKKAILKSLTVNCLGILAIFLTNKAYSLIYSEKESFSYMTVSYYETLGTIKEKPLLIKKYEQFDLKPGLYAYTKKDCAIPSLHTSSFQNVLKSHKSFQNLFTSFIVKENFSSYLKVKASHFKSFLQATKPCSFSTDLSLNYDQYPHPSYAKIHQHYGAPPTIKFKNLSKFISQSASTIKKTDFLKRVFVDIDIYFAFIALYFIWGGIKQRKRLLSFLSQKESILGLTSLIITSSFFIANLGAFEKYRFPIIFFNYAFHTVFILKKLRGQRIV